MAVALQRYLESTPEVVHVLLRRRRPGAQVGDSLERLASRSHDLGESHVAAMRRVRRAVRMERPTIVHAHSSLAGAYVRAASPRGTRIVYTPHCFAFEREDVSSPVRLAFRAAEGLLSLRRQTVAACGEYEALLAASMVGRPTTVHIPHVAPPARPPRPRPTAGGTVVAVGRLTAQKDPGFFAAAARRARRLDPAVDWCWIGDGDPGMRSELEASGVRVTGWLSNRDVLEELTKAHVYAHTASWEGSPLAVLEAMAAGLPVVARRIPPLQTHGLELVEHPLQLADAAVALLRDEDRHRTALEIRASVLAAHTAGAQAEALRRVYGYAAVP